MSARKAECMHCRWDGKRPVPRGDAVKIFWTLEHNGYGRSENRRVIAMLPTHHPRRLCVPCAEPLLKARSIEEISEDELDVWKIMNR